MSEEETEILEKLKKYMQDNIDSGYHKFMYNEYEEDKCIDIINAIDKLQKENEKMNKQERTIDKIKYILHYFIPVSIYEVELKTKILNIIRGDNND